MPTSPECQWPGCWLSLVPGPRRGYQQIGFPAWRLSGSAGSRPPTMTGAPALIAAAVAASRSSRSGSASSRHPGAAAPTAHDVRPELAARRELPLKHPRHRKRITRPDQIPLRPDRALLGQVTALQRHLRHVVTRPHATTVEIAYVIPGPQINGPGPDCGCITLKTDRARTG